MHIVVTLNAQYLKPLCVLLHSLRCAHPGQEIDVHLIHSSLTDADFDFVRRTLDCALMRLHGVRVPETFLADAPVTFHFSKEMYYRIFAAQLLPQTLDRALYLDSDMIVLAPLDALYNMEMGDALFAAARSINRLSNAFSKARLGMPWRAGYFNSGVLLMNLAALRREQDPDADMRYVYAHRSRLLLPDQDALNALYHDRTVLLDPLRYNFDARYYAVLHAATAGRISLERMPEATSVVHYCGKNKPWHAGYRGEIGAFYRLLAAQVFGSEKICL